VVYLKKDDDELVILDPDWLGVDVIGRLLSHETIANLPHDGRIAADDLRYVIPLTTPLDVASLLAVMNLCAPVHLQPNNDIILPYLDRSDEPSSQVSRSLANGHQHASDEVNST